APRGCSNLSLQPLRATVPFQLQRGSAPLCREPKAEEFPIISKVDKTAARPPRPTIRRTLSLDTIVGPYLQGQWPREAEATGATCINDKATQVAKLRHHLQKRSRNAPPSAGYELLHGALPAGQAAGVTQTVPMMPLNRLAPRLRRSVEGLSLELEEVFVSEKPNDEHEILDIPDGHRAPVPAQRCSS
uniref:Family with sequence similarity 117 member Aa n=1 Tax=Poecilia formosa TaxID=48698 RepID=A0A096LZZ4_POEFO